MTIDTFRQRVASNSDAIERLLPILIAVLAIAATFLFWRFAPSHFLESYGADFVSVYLPEAQDIVESGDVLSYFRDDPVTLYPPGHSLLIAAFLKIADWTLLAPRGSLALLSVLSAAVSAVLFYKIAALMWQPLAAFLAAMVWISYPFPLLFFAVGFNGRPLSELTFFPVLMGSILTANNIIKNNGTRYRDYIFTGFLAGLMALIRPISFGMILVFAALVLLQARRFSTRTVLTGGLIMLFVYVVVLIPWEVVLYRSEEEFVWLSPLGQYALRDGLTSFAIIEKDYRQATPVPEDVMDVMENYVSGRSETASYSEVLSTILEEGIIAPLATVKLFLIKAIRSWYGSDDGRNESLIAMVQLIYLVPSIIGMLYGIGRHRVNRSLAMVLIGSVLYFWSATVVAVVPIFRYTMPAATLLIAFIPGIIFLARSLVKKIHLGNAQ